MGMPSRRIQINSHDTSTATEKPQNAWLMSRSPFSLGFWDPKLSKGTDNATCMEESARDTLAKMKTRGRETLATNSLVDQ